MILRCQSNMQTCPNETILSRLLDDELDHSQRTFIEIHIDHCAGCQRELDRLIREEAEATQQLGPMFRAQPVPAFRELAAAVVDRIASRPPSPRGSRDGSVVAEEAWPRVDGYEILGEVGRGGMAVVYQARHVALDRLVALKMPLVGRRQDASTRGRIQEEARTLARLRHPNIVKVYDVGDHEGLPYFSLELVAGTNLSRWMNGLPQEPRLAAQIIKTVAIAIDYAHRNGVLHRDLTPGNVLIGDPPDAADRGEGGALVPAGLDLSPLIKVTDFGLAKVFDELGAQTARLTEPGLVVGTPQYMAPEQARLEDEVKGPATDVYALGAILYELLAGRPPFPDDSPLKTLYRVVHDQPTPLSLHVPRLPRDLTTICSKCMEKDPRRRYASASAVAEDLRRYLAFEPILARPIGTVGRLRRWVRRRPSFAILLFTTIAGSLTLFVIIVCLWRDAARARGRAEDLAASEASARAIASRERDDATRARMDSDRLAAELLLDESLAACARGELEAGLNGLDVARRQSEAAGLEDIEHACRVNIACWARQRATVSESPPLGSSVLSVAFSPDGRRLLSGQWANIGNKAGPGVAQLWDPRGWKPIGPALHHDDSIVSVAFSPDGRRILTGDLKGGVRLWDAGTGRPLGPMLHAFGSLKGVAFHPDGRRFAAGGTSLGRQPGGEACIWEPGDGGRVAATFAPGGPVDAIAFSPDGRSLATASRVPGSPHDSATAEVCLWDLATGKRAGPRLIHGDMVRALAFRPDGKLLATGGDERVAVLWDRESGRRQGQPLIHPERITALAFAPDGKTLVIGGGERKPNAQPGPIAPMESSVRLWDLDSGRSLTSPWIHPDMIHGLSLAGDAKHFATACRDGKIRVFELDPILLAERQLPSLCTSLTSSPDGRLLIGAGERSGSAGGWSQVWLPESGEPVRPAVEHPSKVLAIATTGKAGAYALALENGQVRVLDSRSDRLIGTLRMLEGSVESLAFSPGGDRLLATVRGRVSRLWDWRTGEIAWTSSPDDMPHATTLGPDGRMLLTNRNKTGLDRWNVEARASAGLLWDGPPRKFLSAGFSPDGRLAIAGDDEQVARCWELASGRITEATFRESTLWRAQFTGDGSRAYVVAGYGVPSHGYFYLWEPFSARPPQRLPYLINIRALDLDLGGKIIATGGWNGGVRVWDERTGRQIGPELTNTGNVIAIACSQGGQLVASCDEFSMLRIWRLPLDRP